MSAAADISVRMGERAISRSETLVCFGLGSCIGLVLVDRRRRLAGMAHIMLPEPAHGEVPALVDELVGVGALRPRIEAVIVGGAKMFATASDALEIGVRNEEAVREALHGARIPLRAAITGGSRGRTMRVRFGDELAISVKEAGGIEEMIA